MTFQINNTGKKEDNIYPEQEQTADLIHQEFLNGKNQVELRADCQQGKTGTVFCAMNQCGASARRNGAELFVLYLVAQSSTMLKNQTEERITVDLVGQHGANFVSNKIVVFHHGDALSYINKRSSSTFSATKSIDLERSAEAYRPSKDYLLVVLDESHIGTSQDSVVDKLLISLGIERGSDPSEWENKRAWLLLVSATDFGNEAGRKAGSNLSVVDMVKSPKYFGTDDLLARSFPRTSKDGYFDKNGNLSLWMVETVLPEMLRYISGPFAVRNSGTNSLVPTARLRVGNAKEGTRLRDATELWARSNGFLNPKGIVFHSGGKGDEPIERLKLKKYEKPRKEVGGYDILFLIIIDAVAAGTTIDLESTCLAVEAIPPKSGNAVDAKLVQEAGRYNGYHGWTDFPVFLHQPSLERYVQYRISGDVIPSGTNVNASKHFENACRYEFVLLDSNEYKELQTAFPRGTSKLTENNSDSHDLANKILLGRAYSAGPYTDDMIDRYRAIVLDGASTKYPDSWAKLLERLRFSNPTLFDPATSSLKTTVVAFPVDIGLTSSNAVDATTAKNLLAKRHVLNRSLQS